MPLSLTEIADQIKLIPFGKYLHPITLILSFIFSMFFVVSIVDKLGEFFGWAFFIFIVLCGYCIQQYITVQLKKKLLDTIEVIDTYNQEIQDKILLLVSAIERDIAFDGINVHDIDDIRDKFNSILQSIYLFRKKLKVYFIIKLICFSFGEPYKSLQLRNTIKNMEIYLAVTFQRNLETIRINLNKWIDDHKLMLSGTIKSAIDDQVCSLTGKGALDLTIKSLESHISDLEKIKVTL